MDRQTLTASEIRNRVVEVRKVRFDSIANHPRNPRKHGENQRQAFRGSVQELGFVSVPLAYVNGAGNLQWCDGHLRGSETGDYIGDVAILDLTDAEADKLLLYADPIAAMAEYESQQLSGLLKSVNTSDEALQKMLDGLADAAQVPIELEFEPGNFSGNSYAGSNGDSDSSEIPSAAASYVRMVQLFFDINNVEDFNRMTVELGKRYETRSLTETVMEAVSREYHTGE